MPFLVLKKLFGTNESRVRMFQPPVSKSMLGVPETANQKNQSFIFHRKLQLSHKKLVQDLKTNIHKA